MEEHCDVMDLSYISILESECLLLKIVNVY